MVPNLSKRRWQPGSVGLGLFGVLALAAALLASAAPARALPEYAAQTGEPCASCHTSPAGGGNRTPRGQAWIAAARPGTVPALADALAALGVHLAADEAAYRPPPAQAVPAAPLPLKRGQAPALRRWLAGYQGN